MPKFNPAENYGSKEKSQGNRSFHIPPGTYGVKVEAVELRQPKDPTKAEYFNIRLRVGEGKYNGSTIWDIISTGQRSFWKLADFCKAFGFADALGDIELPEQADIVITKATGCKGWVETNIEEMSNKKLKTRVVRYIVGKEPVEEPAEPVVEDIDLDEDIPF